MVSHRLLHLAAVPSVLRGHWRRPPRPQVDAVAAAAGGQAPAPRAAREDCATPRRPSAPHSHSQLRAVRESRGAEGRCARHLAHPRPLPPFVLFLPAGAVAGVPCWAVSSHDEGNVSLSYKG